MENRTGHTITFVGKLMKFFIFGGKVNGNLTDDVNIIAINNKCT